ncbi:MAG: ADP-ribosylglycohydrolase family protein [Leptolyngbyaceae cyanobacterium MO_188.B28]|nr:ADP-ribosylglycohydrolase family protein [Leptolyngbyaceae cyanobacterium MO_188.B28]
MKTRKVNRSTDQFWLKKSDDADTTAAICGQVAGAYWGESGIPSHWLERLSMGDAIAELAECLASSG